MIYIIKIEYIKVRSWNLILNLITKRKNDWNG